MSDFPKYLYHRTKPCFICPSEDFLNTLKDKDEYEELPFSGPRAIKPPVKPKEQCKECLSLAADNVDLKLEVERLRIALKMAEAKKIEPIVKQKDSEFGKKMVAARAAAKAKRLADKV